MQINPLTSLNPFGSPTLDGLDVNDIQDGKRIGGAPGRQYVRFYNKKEIRYAKAADGKVTPYEKIVECVHIKTPGDTNETDGHAEEFHRREHWKHYRAFREGRMGPVGIPVEEAPFISQHIATELKILGCHTIEQLADASDVLCGQIPHGFEVREFARAFVKAQVGNKSLEQVMALKREQEASQKVIVELQQQIESMKAMLFSASGDRIETEAPTDSIVSGDAGTEIAKKRGRPRKIETV